MKPVSYEKVGHWVGAIVVSWMAVLIIAVIIDKILLFINHKIPLYVY